MRAYPNRVCKKHNRFCRLNLAWCKGSTEGGDSIDLWTHLDQRDTLLTPNKEQLHFSTHHPQAEKRLGPRSLWMTTFALL